ncbi:4Fe-4S ferredoxin [Alkalispirochaeta odontotermitis]|nr:4Fe-4S ferredoxin [Alkalispirochaeta odontotermitis]CAB1076791.1 heterodisulfide reductase, subunit A/methylviologen reducing hydrogenase, subunit delta [Olavius algarvensis Delta 1 endosymbiont]
MSNSQQPHNTEKIGSVTVIGSGIAGIQTALDIANSGFKVHLVEEKPSVGGVMAQLDKTFPTNDCSSCMMGPKLAELANHPNIELLAYCDVLDVQGDPGCFQLTLKQKPRYIDADKCTACGDCTEVCPVLRPGEHDMQLADRKATYIPYPQAVPNSYTIEKYDPAPCRTACPANINVQAYVAMVKSGRYREAVEIIMQDLPLPGVLGRVCPHACEKSCRRQSLDEAVSIRELKRVAADHVDLAEIPVPDINPRGQSVAVVGSGPAGLSAAYFLALDGYRVDVYESMPQTGGMLRYGIPEHRLPRAVLDAEIANLQRYGINIHTNTPIGRDFTLDGLQNNGAAAIFLAIGAWQSLKLNIPGEELFQGVTDAISFLGDVHSGKLKMLAGRVVVIGGGHSALDAARVALRLGAGEVHILYRRSRAEMPAGPEEVMAAEDEGIRFHFQAAPIKILDEHGNVSAIQCIRTRLAEADDTGRPRPVPVEGSEFVIQTDHIIPAIGQTPDFDLLGDDHGLALTRWNLLSVNTATLQTNRPAIFAGGDVITGPVTVIDAIAAGKTAAKYIGDYLQGKALPAGAQEAHITGRNWAQVPSEEPVQPRMPMPTLPLENRLAGFEEVNPGPDEKAAQKEAARCLDCGGCCECMQCVAACQAEAVTAVTHARPAETFHIETGSIILAGGFTPFDARLKGEYGYGRWPNVITSLEYERMLSAAGPFQGHIQRLSDGSTPRRIAWIQCVGSRDSHIGREYCSAVCCMYATKQAMITREHAPDIATTIFYIDIRAQGKGFDRFYERSMAENDVRYVRSMISRVVPNPEDDTLSISYATPDRQIRQETFDLVVLSVGLCPNPSFVELAQRMGIRLDAHGFCATDPLEVVATSRPGVYVCGAAQGPKDIPDSVQQGSSAAERATALLAAARGSLITVPEIPPEREVGREAPRIGVFVCHCGINIAGTVDVAAVAEYVSKLDNVVHAADCMFACSTDQLQEIKDAIDRHKLNRVVVASCTPRTHEPLFRNTLRDAGLNPYLFELANIREQDAWVHQSEPQAATEKAKSLVSMSVARARRLEPLYETSHEVVQRALVIGGGLAGLTAALAFAEQGFEATLVEQAAELGGNARTLYYTEDGVSLADYVQNLARKVEDQPLITVYKEAQLTSLTGSCGNFNSTISVNNEDHSVSHGVVVAATGGQEYEPTEYLYGQHPAVVTQKEFEALLNSEPERVAKIQNVVMIQCVGSREPENLYCSRVCCTAAVKNSLKLKSINPDAQVSVLYRDIRTFGLKESYYLKARQQGTRFFRFEREQKPQVASRDDRLAVDLVDAQLQAPVQLSADLVVLSAAIRPRAESKQLAEVMRLALDEDDFFMEAHPKLRPLDFATPGVYLCGLAQGPKFAAESIAQARGAVSRAVMLLSKKEIVTEGMINRVDERLCRACGECENACIFEAISVKETIPGHQRAMVIEALCRGCGVCNVACPTGAASVAHFKDEQIEEMI